MLFAAHVPEVQWTDNMHQGYVRVVLTHSGAEAAFVAVDTVLSTDYRPRLLRTARIVRARGALAFRNESAS